MLVNGMETVKAGFVALTDCAPLVIAQELGFDRQAGIRIEPVRLKSWTAVRDELAFEKLECAHMPGALSLAMHLGLSGVQTNMRVPLMLGSGGNSITVSTALYDQGTELLGGPYVGPRSDSAVLVKAVVEHRRKAGGRKVRLGSVHPFSSHNYELRAWLAHAGLDPDKDVELSVVPRSKMVEALATGAVDGYCVGDPWGQMAVEAGVGITVATKADLYPNSPEKVLAFRSSWVQGHEDVAAAATSAIQAGLEWAADQANHVDLAQILAQKEYLNVASDTVLRALSCQPRLSSAGKRSKVVNYIGFSGESSPTEAGALWLLAHMRRWGQVPSGQEHKVCEVFMPLAQSTAASQLDEESHFVNRDPSEQAFDGVAFGDNDIEAYWRSFPISCSQ